jgi:hypothetical protein
MQKRGVELTFNTIVIAAIALIVLIVIIIIYTKFIGKSSEDINRPADEAGQGARDAAWCMQSYLTGGECVIQAATSCSGNKDLDCKPATWSGSDNKCGWTCSSGYTNHKIAGKGTAIVDPKQCPSSTTTQSRLCCCQ